MKAWLASTLGSAAFGVGVGVGVLSVYLAPGVGLRDVNARLVKAEGLAAAQQARGDQSETNRALEADDATSAVEAGRRDCQARASRQQAILERSLALCQAREAPIDETSCSCAAHGPLQSYSDWVSNPVLDDPGAGDAGSAKPGDLR